MHTRGFTLIELLVALAIMAIISAVAVPIYTEYSGRTQRTNAEKDLMMCAQGLERLASSTANFSYGGHALADMCTPTSTAMYTITVEQADANGFRLRATPIATAVVKDDGMLEIAGTGAQRWDRNHNGTWEAADNGWSH